MRLFAKVVIGFLLLAVLAGLAAWLAETPGTITLAWRGWRVDTSVGVLVAIIALLVAVCSVAFHLWRRLLAVPAVLTRRHESRQRERGYRALTRGMVAIAAGDAEEARRQAKLANELLDRPAGALLIGAQAAQAEGRPETARRFYEAMTEREETRLLGLRGLLALAEADGDRTRALTLAEEARQIAPQAPWLLTRLFHLQVAERRWEAAEKTLRQAIEAKAVDRESGRHEDAVLMIQLSLMAEKTGDARLASERARKALDLDPGFLPATLQLVALLHAEGKDRQARRRIEEAWAAGPHPDLARLYGAIAGGADPLKRLKAIQSLARSAPEHRESHLALARAALDARLFGEARRHLKEGGGTTPDAGFCRLHAELEEAEHGDAVKARDWLSRASDAVPEPAWLCSSCGAVAREWSALCGHCGAFDSLHWGVPPRVAALPPQSAEDRAAATSLVLAETEPDGEARSG